MYTSLFIRQTYCIIRLYNNYIDNIRFVKRLLKKSLNYRGFIMIMPEKCQKSQAFDTQIIIAMPLITQIMFKERILFDKSSFFVKGRDKRNAIKG